MGCLYGAYSPGKKHWINSNGKKMKTKHPVEGQLAREFPAICNHCGVMTAWSRKTWKFCEQFLHYFKKRPLMVKFSEFLFVSNVVNFVWREIGEIVRYSHYKKKQNFGSLSNCRYCTDGTQNLPGSTPKGDDVLLYVQTNTVTICLLRFKHILSNEVINH